MIEQNKTMCIFIVYIIYAREKQGPSWFLTQIPTVLPKNSTQPNVFLQFVAVKVQVDYTHVLLRHFPGTQYEWNNIEEYVWIIPTMKMI